jgi:phosphopantothenoylcysteine decarboxylase/phosphopantothenate--cysteine ligase
MSHSSRILLVIGGGIAAYKSLDLIRRLRDENITVRVVLTQAAQQFITPLAAAALSGEKVFTDLFAAEDEAAMGHIQLSRNADLIVVAPATADLMARMAQGHASDLASTVLLATDKPVLIVPAMNVRMWNHPATRRNLAILKADGIGVVGPEEGSMACGEFGPGRMAGMSAVVSAVKEALSPASALRPLAGLKVLITSGPTHEPIDPVRVLANRSSGKQGHAIAEAALKAGAEVVLVSGPVSISDPVGADVVHVETARQMLAAVEAHLPADVVICAAAVADWRVADEQSHKIKKTDGAPPVLEMVENPDILATVSRKTSGRPGLVIGFAAETEDVLHNARQKRERKGCDWIVANGVSPESGVFGGDSNQVYFVSAADTEILRMQPKQEVARLLIMKIAKHLSTIGTIST